MTKEEKIQILRETIDVKADIFLALNKLECKTGIEIGVRNGGNLRQLSHNNVFSKGKLVGLDCWREVSDEPTFNDKNYGQDALDKQYTSVVSLFAAYPWIEIVRDFSVEGSARFEDGYFDFIYIDAAHDYKNVKKDVEAWWPKLKSGGVFSGHDYFPDHRVWRGVEVGVYKAVNEFAASQGTEVHHTTKTELEGGPNKACNSFFIVK